VPTSSPSPFARRRSLPARVITAWLCAALAIALAASLAAAPANPAAAQTDAGQPVLVEGAPLTPPSGEPDAVIRRTSFGIPHIVARDWTSLGFGHGYATAEDSICVLADTVLAARGERSRFLGPDAIYDDQVTLRATNLEVDTLVGSLRQRGVVEALLADPVAGPSDRAKALVEGYVQGINRLLDEIGGPDGITDPACRGAAFIDEVDSLDLWYGVYLANLLASAGVFVPQIVGATPPSASDPGLPFDPGTLGLPTSTPAADLAAIDLSSIDLDVVDRDALLRGLGRDPERKIGSNGTALGRDATDTGRGMVLGNPHFPWINRYRFHQAQLTIPGVYDVAGASLTGSPVINIGWNDRVAWTHTVSTAFRFTPYEYRLVPGAPTTYLTAEGPQELQRDEIAVEALGEDGEITTIASDLYRTDEGFVLSAPEIFLGWSPASVWAIRDANAEHLQTVDVFLEMGEAGDVDELLAAHTDTGGMPWVNTMAADRDGNALYADHSVVPHVTNAQVQECATPVGQVLFELAGLPGLDGTRAAGACAWGTDDDAPRPGIFGPGNLPDTTRDDWVINANDSHWLPNPAEPLEGFARIIGCEECQRSLRTRMVYRYVLDRLDGSDGMGGPNLFSHQQLQDIQTENRVFAGELAREGDDLTTACEESGVREEACDVLAAWDGRTDTGSVGAILFREFWLRGGAVFEEAFDPERPVETPRDLDGADAGVQQAVVDAVAALDDAGIALDATLGSEQIAGDEPGERIAIHGGIGATGSANVVVIRRSDDVDARYPVVSGSSHIQAVSFTDRGVDAATILTYGNSTDPTSPNATDQTRLWSEERWVDWAFTTAEQLADPGLDAYRVGTAVDRTPLTPAESIVDPLDPMTRVERVAGGDRIATSVAVSRRTNAIADTVVLATAGDFPDALAGGPLATSLGGPLLLTGGDGLDPRVAAEIDRLGASQAVLLGGPVALSPVVEADLATRGLSVERISGADRYATAAAIADRLPSDLAFLATGEGFPDAVAAAGVAAALGAPVVLTPGGSLADVARQALDGRTDVVVAGGSAAIADAVVAELGARAVRAAGDSRYATAASLFEAGIDRGLAPQSVWVAAGSAFPDALSAAAAAGAMGTGVVLVDDGAVTPVADLLAGLAPMTVLVAGGPSAVPEGVLAALR
jgi:acyl-homoserine-lactone acylase